jgi:4-hydroxy-tetrahydrodipicolinate synthase
MQKFAGVYTALVTPFLKGHVDVDSLRQLVRFQLENGIQGLVINGTTAESPCLTHEEKKQIFAIVKSEVAGQVPLIMGTGTNSTAETIRNTKEAMSLGADAALIVVPYYNKPPQRGLFQHYYEIASQTEIPILLYNVPGRTITGLELETIEELSRVPRIIGIKEATGDVVFGGKIVSACGPDFLVTSGDDASYLELLRVGGKGIISVASHILPREFVRWSDRVQNGHTHVSQEITKYMGFISQLYVEANPIPVKMALFLLGIIASPEMRLPLVTLGEQHTHELKRRMQDVGIL